MLGSVFIIGSVSQRFPPRRLSHIYRDGSCLISAVIMAHCLGTHYRIRIASLSAIDSHIAFRRQLPPPIFHRFRHYSQTCFISYAYFSEAYIHNISVFKTMISPFSLMRMFIGSIIAPILHASIG